MVKYVDAFVLPVPKKNLAKMHNMVLYSPAIKVEIIYELFWKRG